jgi:gamma-glutamyltranspeptidase/glutathione hydrolase
MVLGQFILNQDFLDETIRTLTQWGHKVSYQVPGNYGGYQCIRYDAINKVYYGASDPRKMGWRRVINLARNFI